MKSPGDIPMDILFSSSYVLDLRIVPYVLEITMDFALTPEHPKYTAPDHSEQECYRRGYLRLRDFRKVEWAATGNRPSRDATGEADFGNLDDFTRGADSWHLAGDFGTINVEGGNLSIEFED